MEDFGSRLKELRLSKGMSLRDLADACNTSKSAIGYYENNQRRPKYETLEAFADIFNVDMNYLLGKSNIKNSVAHSLGFSSLEEAYKAGALGSFPFSEENPTAMYDGISEKRRELIEFAMTVPEEKAEMILRVMKSIVEAD